MKLNDDKSLYISIGRKQRLSVHTQRIFQNSEIHSSSNVCSAAQRDCQKTSNIVSEMPENTCVSARISECQFTDYEFIVDEGISIIFCTFLNYWHHRYGNMEYTLDQVHCT